MSFQSIPREGWKSQKLLIKLCHDCLSKRPVFNVRRYTSIAPAVKPNNVLELFRHELYEPSSIKNTNYSPLVQTTIARREHRKRLLKSYQLIKNQQPALLSELTQADLDRLMSYFSKNPNDPLSNGAFFYLFQIYKDVKANVFPKVSFRLEDLENMIYVATELDLLDPAEKLLREAVVDQHLQVSIQSYEAVIRLLSKHKRMDRMEFWLDHISAIPFTRDIVQSVVLCELGLGHLEKAAQFLRQHHPGGDLAQLVSRHSFDDREMIDQALTVFAMDSLRRWRLNDMRLIYARKRHFGLSTRTVVRHLVDKGLHTGHAHTVEKLLSDTIYFKDTASTQLCAKKLIGWYLANKNITHAVEVWKKLNTNQLTLPLAVLEPLVVQSAKLKYHEDSMRLYKQCKELYPKDIQPETSVHVLRGLVRSKQFNQALNMTGEVEALIPHVEPHLARLAVSTLFGLCAQTGNLSLFERVFQVSEKLQLDLTHRGLTSLIALYLSRNDVDSAKSAFQSMSSHTKGPDVVDFNLLMRTVAMEDKANVKDKILDILKHMKLVNVQPDQTTLRTMLGIYDNESDIQNGLFDKLLAEKPSTRFDQVFLNNIALTQLLQRTNVGYATHVILANDRGRLFPSQKNQPIYCNELTFMILMHAAAKDSRYANIAEKVFKSMRARGMKPNKEVYENLVGVIASNGKIKKARQYISMMEQDLEQKADTSMYLKLVDGLIKLNKPQLAKEVIEENLNGVIDKEIRRRLKKIDKLVSNK